MPRMNLDPVGVGPEATCLIPTQCPWSGEAPVGASLPLQLCTYTAAQSIHTDWEGQRSLQTLVQQQVPPTRPIGALCTCMDLLEGRDSAGALERI